MAYRFNTRAIHAGASADPATGARVQPIHQSNGYVFKSLDHGSALFGLEETGFAYGRSANPTVAAFERRVADLEGGTAALATASGQSALLAILTTLCRRGDEVIAAKQVFGGTVGLLDRFRSQFGIRTRYVDPHDLDAVQAAITPKTRGLLIEAVLNPTGDVVDLAGLSAVARAARIPLIVDSTLTTPALLRPIEHGADIVWHSASKFFSGHGTAIGGVIVDSGNRDWIDDRYPAIVKPMVAYDRVEVMKKYPAFPFMAACRLITMRELGPCLAPLTAFLLQTGIETLPLRMQKHSENALALHQYLSQHAKVKASSHPALAGHPRHNLAATLLPKGMGSVQLVTLKGGLAAARRVTERLKYFSQLVNVGEARSLVAHPQSTTHRNVDAATRRAFGIDIAGSLRLSVGLEDAADLIADFEQALR
jgi:O-acetylhomoserine (thiol)-lyase